MTPRIKIYLNKDTRGVSLATLANVSRETMRFLTKLSADLGDPENQNNWSAEAFGNGSVHWDVLRKRQPENESPLWSRALKAVFKNDFSDPVINVRIREDTRAEFWRIAAPLQPHETLTLGVEEGEVVEWFDIDKELARKNEETSPEPLRSYGEIQGVVHALYKESKHPKIVVRELSTQQLVDCFFSAEQYEGVVALLEDKTAVIFIEGEVKEDPVTGYVTEIQVETFTPAPDFDEAEFSRLVGTFHLVRPTPEEE